MDLNLRLSSAIGAASDDRNLELYLTAEDRQQASSYLRQASIPSSSYVIAYYGGRTVLPDFLPLPSFVQLVRAVTDDRLPVILIGAGNYESKLAHEIGKTLPHSIVATGLPLRVSAALIESARLFIGLSSGPAHMAAAAGTPALVVLRPDTASYSERVKWLPVGDDVIALAVEPHLLAGNQDWSKTEAVQHARRLLVSKQEASVG